MVRADAPNARLDIASRGMRLAVTPLIVVGLVNRATVRLFNGALAVAQQLAAQGHGTMVAVSSLAGQRSRPSILPYGAAKAGLDAFTEDWMRRSAGAACGSCPCGRAGCARG